MRNGKCPKCNSTSIYSNSNGVDYGGRSYQIEVWIGPKDSRLARQSNFISYICANCGYFENYLDEKDILDEIQKKWSKVK